MQSVLIVEPFDVFRTDLENTLKKDLLVYSCGTGEEAARLLQAHRPDCLFLNMRLPDVDGLYFLQKMISYRPPVVLTIAPSYTPFVEQHLVDLNVAHLLTSCCPVRAAAYHIRFFLDHAHVRVPATAQEIVANHLRILGVPHQSGFDDLRIGTPLFAQAPGQSMTKEFYPAVADLRGRDNWKQVEKAIRTVKLAAYRNRNDAVWKEYFPDTSECPTNKDFIARLAEFVS